MQRRHIVRHMIVKPLILLVSTMAILAVLGPLAHRVSAGPAPGAGCTAALGNCDPNPTCSVPSGNPYIDSSQCVYRAWELAAAAGHPLPQFGNACAWRQGALNCGYTVRDSLGAECVDSVAVWSSSVAPDYGHVGWVTAVDGNRFYVKDRNWIAGQDYEHWVDWQPGISFITFGSSTHLECINNTCVRRTGPGSDQCLAENSSCGDPSTHLTCIDGRCTRVSGAGSDACPSEGSTSSCDIHLTNWTAEYLIDRSCGDWRCNTPVRCTETIQGELNKTWTSAPCSGMSKDDWGARFTTSVDFAAGDYVFHARHDDGVKIWLDDEIVLDKFGSCGTDSSCPKVPVSSGRHTVRVVYRQDQGEAYLRVWWDGDDRQCNENCSITADQVILHTQPDYMGLCVTLGEGEYPLGALGHIGNDNLRSVEVGANVQLLLFEDDAFGGLSETINSGDRDLADNQIGYNTSSVKVLRRSCPVPAGAEPTADARMVQIAAVGFGWSSGCAQSWLEYWSDADPQRRGPDVWLSNSSWSAQLACGRYQWHVKGKNAAGTETAWSLTYAFSVVPATPTGLRATNVGETEVSLAWDDPGGQKDGYVLELDNGSRLGAFSQPTATLRGLQGGTTYVFRVRAVAGPMESDPSSTLQVTTKECGEPALSAEGEAGSLTAPMQTGSDNGAQGGRYVFSPVGNSGSASYVLSVAVEGDYELWGRVAADSLSSNSFRVRLDDLPGVTWDLPVGSWSRVRVTDRAGGGAAPIYHLSACSRHTLTITALEANARLDVIELCSVQVTPTATVVAVLPPVAYASVNVPVTASVAVSNVTNLGAFEFTLGFDPVLLQVNSVSLGSFPNSSGRDFVLWDPQIDNARGMATVRAFSTGTTPVGPDGCGTLCLVQVMPRAAGSARLTLSGVQVTDIQGVPIPSSVSDGMLSISECPGDLDGDGQVTIADVQAVAYRLGAHCGESLYEARYDFDNNCSIDISDVQRVAYRLGMRCGVLASAQAQSPATGNVSVLPMTSTVQTGETFSVDIIASGLAELGAFDLTLDYDPALVDLTSAQLGAFPSSTGRTVVAIGPTIDSMAGTLRLGCYSLGSTPNGPTGTGALAIVTFRARRSGQSLLELRDMFVTDPTGAVQALTHQGGQVNVTAALTSILYLPSIVK